MILELTPEQVEAIRPHLQHGQTLLARIDREQFDGSNADTAGAVRVEFGAIPSAALPALRDAVREARNPTPKKKAKKKEANLPLTPA